MAAQPGPADKVKLETMIRMETSSSKEFTVLIQVTASPEAVVPSAEQSPDGAGVDLVAVLDISGRMNHDNQLERMKEAMVSVMEQLGPDDRLCLLSFNDEVQQLTELCPMTDENWEDAMAEVEDLTAPPGGGADVQAATEAAATILAERGEEEQRSRVGRVIFLSNGGGDDDGAGPSEQSNSTGSTTIPDDDDRCRAPGPGPGAFVLGADDRLSAVSFSDDSASGAYAYASGDAGRIKDDAAGLTSVDAGVGVQIDLHAQEGVAISSIGSGSGAHPLVTVGPGGPRSLTVYVHDLYAGEQKRFAVYLTAPPEGKEELLAVTGWYRDPENGEDVQLGVCEVSVPPLLDEDEATAAVDSGGEPRAQAAAAAELDRVEVEAGKKETVPDPDVPGRKKETAAAVPEPEPERMFAAALMNIMVWIWGVAKQAACTFKKQAENRRCGKVKITWAWARNNPCYSCAVALALLLLLLLLLGAATMLLMSKNVEEDDGNSSITRTDHHHVHISPHPARRAWANNMDNAGNGMIPFPFTSTLDMCPTINAYIYQLALVQGGGVNASLLEQMAQVLQELRVKIKTPAREKAEEEIAVAAATSKKSS